MLYIIYFVIKQLSGNVIGISIGFGIKLYIIIYWYYGSFGGQKEHISNF